MKRIVPILFLLLFTAACSGEGGEKIDGKQPQNVAIEWITADVQNDYQKQYELIQSSVRDQYKKFLLEESAKKYPKNNSKLKSNTKILEYPFDKDTFYYAAKFENHKGRLVSEEIEVIKTKEGWKVSDLRPDYEKYEERIKGIEPRIIEGIGER